MIRVPDLHAHSHPSDVTGVLLVPKRRVMIYQILSYFSDPISPIRLVTLTRTHHCGPACVRSGLSFRGRLCRRRGRGRRVV